MNYAEIIFYILSSIGALLTILIVYGAALKKRSLLLTGLFYYSFLPIIGESMGYLNTKAPHHILFIALFLIQLIIASIRNVSFDPNDSIQKQYAKRMGISLLLINASAAIFILVISSSYPIYLGIFHTIISLSLGYAILQRLRGKLTN
ncbi:MAG: hypothetical protein VW397_02650 [Candidatus Margulisiibacteriota bacterium]